MRSLLLPQSMPGLTDQQFTQSALDSPLSAWRTYGQQIESGFNETFVGTAIRDAAVPGLAIEAGPTPDSARPETRDPMNFAVPAPPSDQPFGMPPSFDRVESPAKVAARGDKLYETEDAYKASQWYRERVPFEPGMTESRAKALAEMNDLRAIRDFYGEKRKVVRLFGNITGAALAPENYIPVLGEYAGAATTLRLGRFWGRVATSSADAGLNTLATQLVTAPTRYQLGDDTSWQAIMENAAFAALAGAVFGAGLGGAEKLRARYSRVPDIPAEALRPPEPAVSRETLTTSGDVPASFDAGYYRPTDIIDRIETPAARARAAAVMNDAVTGLAIDGEVRLGGQAQEYADSLARVIGDVVDRQGPYRAARPQNVMEFIASIGGIRDQGGELAARDLTWANTRTRDGTMVRKTGLPLDTVRERLVEAGFIEDRGRDTGGLSTSSASDVLDLIDRQLNGDQVVSVRDAGNLAAWETEQRARADASEFRDKFGPEDRKFIKRYGYDFYQWARDVGIEPTSIRRDDAELTVANWRRGMTFDEAYDAAWQENLRIEENPPMPERKAKPDVSTRMSFAVPAPEPAPPQLGAAYQLVDSIPKPSRDVSRVVKQAKEEGFDPDTGGNDLEVDIDILRNRGVLSAEDEAALAAADETYAASSAYSDALTQVIACKASGT